MPEILISMDAFIWFNALNIDFTSYLNHNNIIVTYIWQDMLNSFWFPIILLICSVIATDNGLGRTPQMGWNSWNHFGCNISE